MPKFVLKIDMVDVENGYQTIWKQGLAIKKPAQKNPKKPA
jgi:hypothetical protein